MGLGLPTNEKKTYLGIVSGKLAKRVPEGTVGAISREIEWPKGTKKTIWEMLHPWIEAKITNIEVKEGGDFGDHITIDMEEVGEVFCISLSAKSREGKSFMMCLPNIDLSKPVRLEPYNYVSKENKKVVGLSVKQGGKEKENQVAWYYNKDNGMPMAEEGAERLGKDEFELLMASQTIFLKKSTKKFIEGLKNSAPPVANGRPENLQTDESFTATSQDDDLPF